MSGFPDFSADLERLEPVWQRRSADCLPPVVSILFDYGIQQTSRNGGAFEFHHHPNLRDPEGQLVAFDDVATMVAAIAVRSKLNAPIAFQDHVGSELLDRLDLSPAQLQARKIDVWRVIGNTVFEDIGNVQRKSSYLLRNPLAVSVRW